MDELWLVGRVLFSTVFLVQGIVTLADLDAADADATRRGVPGGRGTSIAVALAYVLGGLSVTLGLWGDIGALLLIIALLPMTFIAHRFWAERDPLLRQAELASFLKNVSLIGGAVVLFSFFARDTFGLGLPYTVTDGVFGFR